MVTLFIYSEISNNKMFIIIIIFFVGHLEIPGKISNDQSCFKEGNRQTHQRQVGTLFIGSGGF